MSHSLEDTRVLVVGARIMGSGIAQVAAQAGHAVLLFDAREGVATAAKVGLVASTTTIRASIPTAARSRWATRWALAGRA